MRRGATIVALVLGLLVLAWPVSAMAARPVPGGRYLLMARGDYGHDHSGVLQLSGSGRALTSDGIPFSPLFKHHFGSYLERSLSCGQRGTEAYFFLGAPGYRPVLVDSGGRFTTLAVAEQAVDSVVVELRGRLVSRSEAVVEIVGGTYQPTEGMASCPIPRQRFVFRLRPMPPFGSCATAPGRTVLSTARSRLY